MQYFSIYGDHIVKYGEKFVWNIEITKKSGDCHLGMGIIPNKEDLLMEYQENSAIHRKGGYLWAPTTGYFLHDGTMNKVFEGIWCLKTGDKFKIEFNWKESLLQYSFNGKDLGNALKEGNCKGITTEKTAEFRLFVTIKTQGEEEGTFYGLKIDSDAY